MPKKFNLSGMIKKRSKSPSNALIHAAQMSDLSEDEDCSQESDDASNRVISFEEYIQEREPSKKKRELLLYIAPLLRNSKFNIEDIADITKKPRNRLKEFLDQYPDCIISILHE